MVWPTRIAPPEPLGPPGSKTEWSTLAEPLDHFGLGGWQEPWGQESDTGVRGQALAQVELEFAHAGGRSSSPLARSANRAAIRVPLPWCPRRSACPGH